MDKYIKESELFKRILNVDFKHDYDGCIKFCQSIPAADVAEVRHGKWVDVEPAPHNLFYATCSVCGERQTIEVANYCPMCGAILGRNSKCVECKGGYCEEECLKK